jgi:hypothetical protein
MYIIYASTRRLIQPLLGNLHVIVSMLKIYQASGNNVKFQTLFII